MEDNVKRVLKELFPEKKGSVVVPGAEIRAGVYLRQSTISGQNCEGVEEQLAFIRYRLVTEQIKSITYPQCKIVLADDLVFMDRGKTGRVGRERYHAFKKAIELGEFKIGLVYDLSRLTRELGSLLDVFNLAQAYSTELISVSELISSHAEGARLHFIAKGMANEMQSESTSRQTRRGLEMRALSGRSTGHNPYGYVSVPEYPDQQRGPHDPANKIVIISEDEAKVVRRVFELYDSTAMGVDRVAKLLNEEGIPSPKGGQWIGRTIYGILKQPRYIGVWIFGRTEIKRDPSKDRLVQVARPQNQWIVKTYEHLRIVPQDLWERIQERLKRVEEERRVARNKADSIWGRHRGQPNHLFTGTMVCGECGGSFMTITGKKGGYLGCRNAYRVGNCSNKNSVQVSWVESALLSQIREWIEAPASLNTICKEFNDKVGERLSVVPTRIKEIETELTKVDRSIRNFVDFIAQGNASETISAALKKAEDQKRALEAQLVNLTARSPQKILITPFALKQTFCNLDEIIKQDIPKANAFLRRLFPTPIRMTPKKRNSRPYLYEAAGEVNLTRLLRYSVAVNGVPNGI